MVSIQKPKRIGGFTLVELLVVIAIIASLASLATVGAMRALEKSRKVQVMAQFRDVSAGLQAYTMEYQRPPIPKAERQAGTDVVYSTGSGHDNVLVVAALMGDADKMPNSAPTDQLDDMNPRHEHYLDFVLAPDKKKGMGPDGILYDPWKKAIMIAVNAPPFETDSASGNRDRLLFTSGFGEYTDTKPREQDFVLWSYGKDGKMGKDGKKIYAGSDDVISW